VPFVLIQPRRIRESLKTPVSVSVDLLMLVAIGGLIGALFSFGKQVAAPFRQEVNIDLSLWALPKYTMYSLARGFAAYALSLIFTLIYGSIAAHNRRAEKVLIPALDILQSLPVLAFLPSVVLAMVKLFPGQEIGLELACIINIFTGQAWNMTFSYYSSVRSLPNPMREVSSIFHLNRWQIFRIIELPASMIGLVWNSMMSFAGGWFILNVTEAFQLNNQDFRLPGVGSYMSVAATAGNIPAQIGAVIAMILMIVAVDQLFWRPIVVWSERFKVEETAQADKAQSWFLNLVQHSLLYPWLVRQMHQHRQAAAARSASARMAMAASNGNGAAAAVAEPGGRRLVLPEAPSGSHAIKSIVSWGMIGLLTLAALWGAWALIRMLISLPLRDPSSGEDWIHVLLALLADTTRVGAAIFLGALWTLPAGILIGLSPKWSQRLQPVVQVLASFPATMLYIAVTIAMVRMRIPFNIGCVVLMVMGTQWYVLFNVIAGAMAIPSELKEVCSVYHTSRWKQWTRVYIPGVFPHLVTGLITAAGGAWNTTIVAECVTVKDQTYNAFGLGFMIYKSSGTSDYPLLAASAVTLALAVVTINRLMWRRLYRLAEKRYSLET
ncbi:MAG: ABC transporter permease subunit, partial [Tepidisphaeraceae bacterium]